MRVGHRGEQAERRSAPADEVARRIGDRVGDEIGAGFMGDVCAELGAALNAGAVLVGEVTGDDPRMVRTRALWLDGALRPPFRYALAGSPCESVFGRVACAHAERAREHFPTAAILKEFGGEGYVGAPLHRADGTPLGVLAVFTRQPIPDVDDALALVSRLAPRVAAEADRAGSEEVLRRRVREQGLLRRIAAASLTGESVLHVTEWACHELKDMLEADGCMWFTADFERGEVHVMVDPGAPPATSQTGKLYAVGPEVLRRFLGSPTPWTVEDMQAETTHALVLGLLEAQGTHGALCVPIVYQEQITGGLWLSTRARRRFSRDEMELAGAAGDALGGLMTRDRLMQDLQLFRSAIEQASDGVVIMHADGRPFFSNAAFREQTGVTFEEMRLGLPGGSDAAPHRLAEMREHILREGTPWRQRLEQHRADGGVRALDAVVAPVRSVRGEVTHLVGTSRDVTREVLLERQYHQSQKLESLGRLAGGVAHDFNNILGIIMGHGQAALEQLGSHPAGAEVEGLLQGAHRAAALVRQLMVFSRPSPGSQPAVFDVSGLVTDAEKMLRRLVGEDVTLQVRTHGAAYARGHLPRIEQVMVNLVVNARDAMPRGGTLELVVQERDPRGERTSDVPLTGPHVVLSVRDTGVGMDEAVQRHLFEPFFTTKPPGKGTGLGLSTSWGIVREHGGHIQVRSKPGEGTTVEVWLPRADAPAPSVVAPAPARPVEVPARRILVVEDELSLLKLLCRMLQHAGYQVVSAGGGEEALEVLSRTHPPPDLLLTDVVMPRMSGPELARRVRERMPGIRVLFTSGYTGEALEEQGLTEKGTVFLAKPYLPVDMLRAIANLFATS